MQIHVRISATDIKLCHDCIGIHRVRLGIQQSMNLRHRFIDTPRRGHVSPQFNELIYRLLIRITHAGIVLSLFESKLAKIKPS